MLKKLRWRFIASAMAAITAVVLVLVGGMNLWNYHITTQRQDEILAELMGPGRDQLRGPELRRPEGLEDRGERPDREPFRDDAPFGKGRSPELRYMLRYFSVTCDESGTATETDRDFIASVTSSEATAWGERVAKSGRTSGYLSGYRYRLEKTDSGSVIFFLNSEREVQSMQTMLLVSSVVAVAGLLVVFVLVALFSKRAIAPYVRNIETQKRFITDAGHELKTPLTAISASADILAEDLPGNEWVDSIRSQCTRMSKLVANLVTLSRLDEEQPIPQSADFSLSDAVWEIAESAQSLAKAKGKTYQQSIEDGLAYHGDREAIGQMVSILLDNAIKYSDKGGTVRLSVARVRGKIQIQTFNTCDTSGIDVKRLFDRFYRPDTSRASHTGGTGIGLAIARATAQAHGGDITAKTENGGLTFTVRL